MFRRLLAAGALLVSVSVSMAALAADPPLTQMPLTAGGLTFKEATYSDGTNTYLEHIALGWDYVNNRPKAWAFDPNGNGGVNVQNFPSAFGISGTLPGFAAPPTVNIGSGGPVGYALEGGHLSNVDTSTSLTAAKLQALITLMGSPLQVSSTLWPYTLNVDGGVPSHLTNGPVGYALEAGHAATIDANTAAAANTAGVRTDSKSTATDTTPASEISLMKGQIDRLQAIVTVLGSTLNFNCASGCGGGGGGGPVTNTGTFVVQNNAPTPAGTNAIGSITNTSFGASQSGNWSMSLLTGTASIGSISNTIFGASQSGTWNVGLSAGTNAIGSVTVSNLPATQAISAAALPLPAGAATQATLASLLAALGAPLQAGGAVSISGTVPISASALPLPAGAATATGVAAVVTALGSPLQAGGSLTVTASALPTGAATSALQGTANTSLATIAANTGLTAAGTNAASAQPVQGVTGGVPIPISGTITTSLGAFAPSGNTVPLGASTTSAQVSLGSSASTVLVTNTGAAAAYVNFGTSSAVTATTASTPVFAGQTIALANGSNTNVAAITASGSTSLTLTPGTGLPAIANPAGSGGGSGGAVTNAGTFAVQNTAATPAGAAIIGKVGIDQTTPGTTNGVVINSGTVSVSGTVPVSGAFFQATQPISASALPLPSGAATASGVAAVVTALGTPFQAGGSVSISGTPTFNLGTTGTVPVSASALPLPSGAATATGVAAVVTALGSPLQTGGAVSVSNFPSTQAVSGTVGATQSGTWSMSLLTGTASIGSISNTAFGGQVQYNTTPPVIAAGAYGPAMGDVNGRQIVIGDDIPPTSDRIISGTMAYVPATGVFTASAAAQNAVIDTKGFGGLSITSGSGSVTLTVTTSDSPTGPWEGQEVMVSTDYGTVATNNISYNTNTQMSLNPTGRYVQLTTSSYTSAQTYTTNLRSQRFPVKSVYVGGIAAGSTIIGKVGIDQTTPGTTNGVVVNASALPTGAATQTTLATVATNTTTTAAGTTAAVALPVQGVTGGVRFPIGQSLAGTNASGTVTTTASTLAAANTSRIGWKIKNDCAVPVWINFYATATATAGGGNMQIPAGAGQSSEVGYTETGAISAITASQSCALTLEVF